MPFAAGIDATLHYTVDGTGDQTILLIMGLGGHASEWGDAFVGDLARDHTLIRIDNRGIAQSRTQARTFSLEDMARDALAVLDSLSLSKVHVLGTSMGGMIAQLLALDHPARVARLVLMSTGFGGSEMLPPEPRALALFEPQPDLSVAEQRRRGLRALTGEGFADAHMSLLEELAAQRARNPTPGRVFAAQLDAILASDRSQRVSAIRAPTLVVHGDQDALVPLENGRRLSQRIPGAQLLVLPGSGHLLHLERPHEAAAAIRGFLRAP